MALIPESLTTVANVGAVSTAFAALATSIKERAIGAVSLAIQKELSRSLGYAKRSTSAPERYQGSGKRSLWVRRWPIKAIEEIKVDGNAITDWLDDADLLARGELWRESGWPKVCGSWGDLTSDPNPATASYNVTLAYSAGYILPQYGGVTQADATLPGYNPSGLASDLPPDLEEAAIDSIIFNSISRPTHGLKSERTAGGWAQEWETGKYSAGNLTLTQKTHALLAGYYSEGAYGL